jgi:putative hydrolase of the HAD superfamily
MPRYRATLFDFFGTLTQSVQRGPQHADIARGLGCDPDVLIGVLDRSFRARARGLFGSAEATLRWVSEQAGGNPCDARLRKALAARVDALRMDTTLRPEAEPTLRRLKARGLRTAVISDCTHELPAFLPQLPIAPLLDACVFSVEVGRCKPDPLIYRTACAELGVAPEECLYIGDGGSRELSGAEQAGMTAVRLDAPDLADHLVFDPDSAFAGPSVRSLADIVAVVDRVPVPA